jgi:hypothetical protein
VHFPDSIDEEFSIPLSQHLAGRDDSLPMSLLAAGKLNFLIVRQFFAIVNIEEVAWHIKTVKRLEFFCNPRLASNPIADARPAEETALAVHCFGHSCYHRAGRHLSS